MAVFQVVHSPLHSLNNLFFKLGNVQLSVNVYKTKIYSVKFVKKINQTKRNNKKLFSFCDQKQPTEAAVLFN